MTAVGTKLNKRSLAWFVALATFFSLVIPLVAATPAWAVHNTLDVEPEEAQNATGDPHTLIATLTNDTGVDDNNGGAGYEIDFEIDCITECSGSDYDTEAGSPAGGPTSAPEPGVEGDQTPQTSDDGRTTPELSCSIANVPANSSASCTVEYTRNDEGDDEVAGWVDLDSSNTTDESDPTEGPDEGTDPGDDTEDDSTDVVSKTWFAAAPDNAEVDCEPEDAENPATGEGSSETYTCTVFDDEDVDGEQDEGEAPVSGVAIDGENQGGANDPDDADAAPVDYNNCGTTDGSGTATCTVNATEAQEGTADICFFGDFDNDTEYDPGGNPEDGGGCDEDPDTPVGANNADVVTKTWVARGQADSIDCEPETDQNDAGTSHTVTCTVTDNFGDPVQGTEVDINIEGRNDGADPNLDNAVTDSNGQVSFTYTDTGDPDEDGQDIITGYIDEDDDDTPDDTGGESSDTVNKFWFAGGAPDAAEVEIDMENDDCETFEENAENNSVGESHDICAEVRDAEGDTIPGQEVTFTTDLGSFVSGDDDNTERCDDQTDEGDTTTATTDTEGEAHVTLCSQETGTATVTATSDGASDSGTKEYEANQPRNLDCEPETATNKTGTQHEVTCLATDNFGNPVPDVAVGANEEGPGSFVDPDDCFFFGGESYDDCDFTDDNGEAEFTTATVEGDEGTQTIEGEIASDEGDDDDAGDLDNPCDQPANEPNEGDPAGNCEDQVSKTWDDDFGQTECNDGIDNDGDGFTDFPDDPECDSPEDDREAGGPTTGPCSQEGAIVGTENDDALTGTEGDDLICGLAGDDLIDGLGGADLILGGADNDTISGGQGADDIRGQGGDDVVSGNGGKDSITGGAGDDSLSGNGGNDDISGGVGADTLKGNRGIDTLRGKKGADTLQGGRGDDILRAGKGRDLLRGFTGDDFLDGGKGVDTCGGGKGDDVIIRCERRL